MHDLKIKELNIFLNNYIRVLKTLIFSLIIIILKTKFILLIYFKYLIYTIYIYIISRIIKYYHKSIDH